MQCNARKNEVTGVDCVLESDDESFTYTIVDGVPTIRGYGDYHQTKYDSFRQSTQVTGGDQQYSNSSPKYRLSLYPTDDFYDVYTTGNPKFATIGVVCVVVFMSIVFFLYDFFVRREFTEKDDLLSAKRNFVRFVSHEVRTPLNAVCMGLEVVQQEITSSMEQCSQPNDPETITIARSDVSEWLELTKGVLGNTQSAVGVLSDLLNFDKIEAGTLTLELSQVPIWDLIENTLNTFSLAADNQKIELDLKFDNNMYKAEQLSDDRRKCVVVGDSTRLVQVFRNLISNAIKFTPVGGNVVVQARRVSGPKSGPRVSHVLANGETIALPAAGHVEISVRDSGAGMSEDQLKQLFSDGVQFNSNQLQGGGGSGLGLFISKGIVKQHHGDLQATSLGIGQGSTFTLQLPLYRSSEDFRDNYCQSTEFETVSNDSVPARVLSLSTDSIHTTRSIGPDPLEILVVDDSDSNRKLLCRLLERRGHVCTPAVNGQIAVDLVREAIASTGRSPFHTILLDFRMPIKNGPTATRELRDLGCESFIFGVTGTILPEDVKYFLECGANDVLAKPFQMFKLEALWSQAAADRV
eukprot:scaffold1465_cov179-Amphora_coffeaeformis.AAC.5